MMEETNLKVRLVGAIVLVSLAVIFIPMILDGREIAGPPAGESNIPPKPENGFVSKIIPLTPTVEMKPDETEKLVIKKGLSAQVAKEPVKTSSKVESKVQAKPVIVAKASEVKKTTDPLKMVKATDKKTASPRAGLSAWAVQVGNFRSKKNAYALQDKLRKQGFTAFVETVDEDNIPSFRVRVGPELKRELAETLRKKLTKFYKGRTFIVKHPS